MPPPEEKLYRPFGGVSPSGDKTPFISVPSPDVRFSQSIGQALSDVGERVYRSLGNSQIQVGAALAHMGDTFGHISDDLFNRARAIKHVENETAAIEAETKFRIDADQRTDSFRDQTKASGAVGSLEAHMKGLEDSRQQIRATLPNDEARNMYDQHSLRALGTQMARAGDHAATQGKAAALAAANARLKLDLVEIEKNPENPNFDQMVEDAKKTYRERIAVLQGDVGDVAKVKELEITSDFYESKIKGIARSDPVRAQQYMDQLQREGKLIPKDRYQIDGTIKTNQTTIATRKIAGSVTQDMREHKTREEWDKEKGEGERVLEARKLAEQDPIMGKNDQFIWGVEQATRAAYRAEEEARRNAIRKADRGVQGVLLGMKGPNGQRPKTFEEAATMGGDEFRADFAMLDYKKQQYYREKIQSRDWLDSPQVAEEHAYWQGQANSDDQLQQQKVLEQNFFDKQWPMDRILDMFKRQQKIMQGEHKSVHLKHAETVAEAAISNDVPNFKRDFPDEWSRFSGFLENYIFEYQTRTHTLPDDKVVADLAKRFLHKEKANWWSRGRYGMDPSQAYIDDHIAKHPGQGEREAREQWARDMMVKHYQIFFSRDGKPAELPSEPAPLKWMREHGPIVRPPD